ncbi:MAG: hypothetical protein QOG68_2806, partial [Solirubrobacteraceae bacterium]|nr:hypothetical protein [Solirubrobacteraceae bacterium]
MLVVEAPGAVRAWVADRFADTLDHAAATVLGPDTRVEIAGGGDPPTAPRRGARSRNAAAPTAPADPPPGSVR